MSKAERIVEELHKLVKKNYNELLFDETYGEDDTAEGLIGGIKTNVIELINNVLNEEDPVEKYKVVLTTEQAVYVVARSQEEAIQKATTDIDSFYDSAFITTEITVTKDESNE